MNPDIEKLVLYTPDNAFKNVSNHTGSITFPTSVGAGATATVESFVFLSDTPMFTTFFCYFLELFDAVSGSTTKRWYSENVAGDFNVALHMSAPFDSQIGASISPSINGSIVTITGELFNPEGSTATFDPLTVNYVFVEYTLAE